MGTGWSEEDKGSSQHQAPQPVYDHSHESDQEKTPLNFGKKPTSSNNNRPHTYNKLPHNWEAIIKDSDSPIDKSSSEKLYEQLHAGIYLNGKRKKYWVEKKRNINCFMVFANGLSITWGENPRHWYLHHEQTSDNEQITVAELRNVAWLEVHGRFHTKYLSQGVTYQVSYVIMVEYTSYGWEVPVNFRLILPNGTKQEHKENLKQKPKGQWLSIPVGEFKTSPENLGEIEFSIYEYDGGSWKQGLVIKGATIEPKL